MPGEQHSLGLAMVREQFRRGGWAVWHDSPVGAVRLAEVVGEHHVDLIGMTVGTDRGLPALAEAIRQARRASCNPALRIMVGGPLVALRPQVATLVGADAAGTSASQAMLIATQLTAVRDEST
jgi:methanogenic corrinoid protein MtbC1